jgi:hypothetical protein
MYGLVIPAFTTIGFLAGAAICGPGRKGLTMLPKAPSSPIRGIVLVRWSRFVTTMARHTPSYASPRCRYGMFGMDMRRLADVGFAKKPRKTSLNGEVGVWVGDWSAPLSEKAYTNSLPAQYESFKRSMVRMVPKAKEHVGVVVDGKQCTLSGLLGVGHHAGENGITSWVKDPKVREKFKNTTEAFTRTNGIF